MTPTNAARDALDKIQNLIDRINANPNSFSSHVTLELHEAEQIEALLTALSSVDFEALGEAITRLKKGYAQFDTFGTTYAVLYSENNENDLNLIEEAARLVLSLGKPQKIDPLSGTPDGLAGG